VLFRERLAEAEQGREALPQSVGEAENRGGRDRAAQDSDGRRNTILTDGWSASGWRDAAAEYHAARGNRVSIVEIEREKLRRLRRLLDDSVSIDRAMREIGADRPTPQMTVEAVLFASRARGLAALTEPDTQERLARCDAAAIAEINRRIAK
jgi:hypothetical protein